MNKAITSILIIVAVLAVGGFFLSKNNQPESLEQNQPPKTEERANPNLNIEPNPASQVSTNHEVIYTDEGYLPKEIKIKLGEMVVWKNKSGHGMWTSSAMHPTHIIYSGTSLDEHCPDPENKAFDECASDLPGESWSFIFDKSGIWRYHNHVQASHFGSVIVE